MILVLLLLGLLFDISSNKAVELLIHVGFDNTIVVLLYGLLSWINWADIPQIVSYLVQQF